MLPHEEYIEQAYFFRSLRERMDKDHASQELIRVLRQEILSTTNLPMALDYLYGELKLTGGFATAMAKLSHYFTPFQTLVVAEAERLDGKFDFRIGLEVLQKEAEYRGEEKCSRQGVFLYQFEAICRNRLGYEEGLAAVAQDPIFDTDWHDWILSVSRDVGYIDFCEMIYRKSEFFKQKEAEENFVALFGEKEGKIAHANRGGDLVFLFTALQRHLGYPKVPRPTPEDNSQFLLPMLIQRVERMDMRLNLIEEELRGGINITSHYKKDED